MNKMAKNSSSTVCFESVFNNSLYATVNAVSTGTAVVSALCCIFVICLIFLFKKHYFFIQRIILYHCLAALIDSFTTILHQGYQMESKAQNTLCAISGFASQLKAWIVIMDYSVITFTLLMSAVFHKNVARLERIYVVLIFVFPLTFNWIPFIGNSYADVGISCWIRSVNTVDCSPHRLGEIFRIVLWYVPFYSLLIIVITIYLFTITYVARQRCCKSEKKSYDPEIERLRKNLNEDVWRILFFPFGVIFLNTFILVISIYSAVGVDAPFALQILNSLFAPLQGGYIALVYMLDRQTLKRLTYSNIKAAITRARRDTVHEYPAEDGGASLSDSAEHSPTADYRQYGDKK